MKKIILIAISAAAISAYALPTYEPFTEYASQIASSPINLVVTYANGAPVGTNANASISNCLDLATGGYTAPGGEQWGVLNFSGTGSGNHPPASYHGLDIAVVTNNNIFTSANLTALFPSGFPGFPASGGIAPIVENPAQPLLWYTNAAKFTATNIVGNSAVLKFAPDIARPTSGTPRRFTCLTSSTLRNRANWAREITGGIWLSWHQPTWSKGRTRRRGLLIQTGTHVQHLQRPHSRWVHYASHGLLCGRWYCLLYRGM